MNLLMLRLFMQVLEASEVFLDLCLVQELQIIQQILLAVMVVVLILVEYQVGILEVVQVVLIQYLVIQYTRLIIQELHQLKLLGLHLPRQ